MVCGAKRIRSLYLPWMTGVTAKLSPSDPPKGLASLSTIDAATMRLCRVEHPCLAPSEQSLPLGKKDGQIRRRSRWLVHSAGWAVSFIRIRAGRLQPTPRPSPCPSGPGRPG